MKKFNTKTQTWKFKLSMQYRKILEFLERLERRGYKLLSSLTHKNGVFIFECTY
jgi:hypothetical protein